MPLLVAAKMTPGISVPMLHTVSERAMPLLAAGGFHVAPPSELLYTPPLATPASICPPRPVRTVCTGALSFVGFFGSVSAPCATGCQLPPPTDLNRPSVVPAYIVRPSENTVRTFIAPASSPLENDDHVSPSLTER